MPKKKLKRFAENLTFGHLFQPVYEELLQGFKLKGRWHTDYFRNDHPITLELGCGKGEYTVFLAKRHPERNFIGIDIKGARLWRGCRTVADEHIPNVAFIRTKVQYLEFFFTSGEIDQIWITFPDPQPRGSKEQKRLTSPDFLERYRGVLAAGGMIHLKTDNSGLFEYTLDLVRREGHRLLIADADIYHSGFAGDASAITTFYEEMFLAQDIPIKYLQFQLRDE